MKQKLFDHRIFRFLAFCLIAVFSLSSIECGGGGGDTSSVPETGITLAWDAPTTMTDGSPLTDLGGYKVYYGTSTRNYTASIDVGNFTTASLGNISPGTWYIAVTAYDTAGNESDYSKEISTQID